MQITVADSTIPTIQSLEDLFLGLRTLGILEYKAMSVSNVQGYDSIYKTRESQGRLTGLEPNYTDKGALFEYLRGYTTLVGMAIPYRLLPLNRNPRENQDSMVSIMAWEWDYHTEVKKLIEKLPLDSIKYKLHVDSGPLPERQLATLMDLARPGRSQMMLHHRLGSAFYLAFLLVAFEGEEQTLVEKTSGTPLTLKSELFEGCLNCRACQIHCPSGALTEERDFDGKKCISALTQLKGQLGEVDMTVIGKQLYGCDHCQLSCPANSPLFKGLTSDVETVLVSESFNALEPEKLLYLSQKAFKTAYGHLGFSWRGVKTSKRNALINMGNSKNKQYIEVIKTFLEQEVSRDEVLRHTALWALETLKKG